MADGRRALLCFAAAVIHLVAQGGGYSRGVAFRWKDALHEAVRVLRRGKRDPARRGPDIVEAEDAYADEGVVLDVRLREGRPGGRCRRR